MLEDRLDESRPDCVLDLEIHGNYTCHVVPLEKLNSALFMVPSDLHTESFPEPAR